MATLAVEQIPNVFTGTNDAVLSRLDCILSIWIVIVFLIISEPEIMWYFVFIVDDTVINYLKILFNQVWMLC